MKRLILLLVLAGCAGAPSPQSHHTILAGIPVLAASYSSATQVTDHLAVVTKHGGGDFVRASDRYDAALIRSTGKAPRFAEPIAGEPVTVYGTGMFGQALAIQTRVVDTRIWACDGPYRPEWHPVEGACTKMGKGYSYGFAVAQSGIAPGYSGGGAYNSNGDLLGIVVQVGTDSRGRDVAFLYRISDLRQDLQFEGEIK